MPEPFEEQAAPRLDYAAPPRPRPLPLWKQFVVAAICVPVVLLSLAAVGLGVFGLLATMLGLETELAYVPLVAGGLFAFGLVIGAMAGYPLYLAFWGRR